MRAWVVAGALSLVAMCAAEGQLVLHNRTEAAMSGVARTVLQGGDFLTRRFELEPLGAAQVAYWPASPPQEVHVRWNGAEATLTGPSPKAHRGRLVWHLWLFAESAEIHLSPPPRPEPEKRDGVLLFAYFGALPLLGVLVALAVRAKLRQANRNQAGKPTILS